MDLSTRKKNTTKINAGNWIDNIPGWDDLRLNVRGTNSFAYRDATARLYRNLPKSDRNEDGTVPASVNDRVVGQALAEAALLGWENISLAGAVLPYSKETAEKLLTDPEHSDFTDAVIWAANKVNASAPDDAAILGNLPTA